jgi:hypothetical protein
MLFLAIPTYTLCQYRKPVLSDQAARRFARVWVTSGFILSSSAVYFSASKNHYQSIEVPMFIFSFAFIHEAKRLKNEYRLGSIWHNRYPRKNKGRYKFSRLK